MGTVQIIKSGVVILSKSASSVMIFAINSSVSRRLQMFSNKRLPIL